MLGWSTLTLTSIPFPFASANGEKNKNKNGFSRIFLSFGREIAGWFAYALAARGLRRDKLDGWIIGWMDSEW